MLNILQFNLFDYQNYIEKAKYGTASYIIDLILIICFALAIIVFFFKTVKSKYVWMGIAGYAVMLVITIILDLIYSKYFLLGLLAIFLVVIVAYISPHIRKENLRALNAKASRHYLSDDETKEELIDIIIKSVDHFSTRHIGALITIEKENSLNSFIENAVILDANVTFELLDTIFYPNTALHDGAVIIRGNHIICAGAFYPSSNKVDIPQNYGSRHRAAIGISEVTDSFTIIVSEETGRIATTIGGTISGSVSLESLKVSLSQHIIVKKGD